MSTDRGRKVFLDLRRLQDIDALVGSRDTRQFVVTTRTATPLPQTVLNKHFDTLREARAFWCERAVVLEDQGMQRMDFQIMGFHEED